MIAKYFLQVYLELITSSFAYTITEQRKVRFTNKCFFTNLQMFFLNGGKYFRFSSWLKTEFAWCEKTRFDLELNPWPPENISNFSTLLYSQIGCLAWKSTNRKQAEQNKPENENTCMLNVRENFLYVEHHTCKDNIKRLYCGYSDNCENYVRSEWLKSQLWLFGLIKWTKTLYSPGMFVALKSEFGIIYTY